MSAVGSGWNTWTKASTHLEHLLAQRAGYVAVQAEVDERDAARSGLGGCRLQDDVAGVRVAVDEAVFVRHRDLQLEHRPAEHLRVEAEVLEVLGGVQVSELGAFHPLHHQQLRGAQCPMEGGRRERRQRGEHVRELLDGTGLREEVDLCPCPAGVLLRDPVHHAASVGRDQAVDEARQHDQGVEVGEQVLLEVGSLDLERHQRVRRDQAAPVHLRDGGGGHGLVREFGEDLVDGSAQLPLDDRVGLLVGERLDVGVQQGELGDERLGEQVDPGGEQLAELHEGGSQPLQRLAQANGDLGLFGGVFFALGVGVGEVAEALLEQDGGDLRGASDLHRSLTCSAAVKSSIRSAVPSRPQLMRSSPSVTPAARRSSGVMSRWELAAGRTTSVSGPPRLAA
jgi:hypothetical protein